mmetsp:Transcript_8223/g.32398  ORF Transcript_8223/g.32398 Transcript_8223/m.32398 type:complete len:304 (+) Transcript_8223:911-1822(+)
MAPLGWLDAWPAAVFGVDRDRDPCKRGVRVRGDEATLAGSGVHVDDRPPTQGQPYNTIGLAKSLVQGSLVGVWDQNAGLRRVHHRRPNDLARPHRRTASRHALHFEEGEPPTRSVRGLHRLPPAALRPRRQPSDMELAGGAACRLYPEHPSPRKQRPDANDGASSIQGFRLSSTQADNEERLRVREGQRSELLSKKCAGLHLHRQRSVHSHERPKAKRSASGSDVGQERHVPGLGLNEALKLGHNCKRHLRSCGVVGRHPHAVVGCDERASFPDSKRGGIPISRPAQRRGRVEHCRSREHAGD